MLCASCSAGGTTSLLPPKDWPPATPRQPQRLHLASPNQQDPAQWWKENILSLLPDDVYPDAGIKAEALNFIASTNAARLRNGLEPVQMLPGLNEAAQAHAMDQAIRDYWNHRTPEGLGSRDRIAAAGLGTVIHGAENSATARPNQNTVDQVVRGFETHAGHRELLLSPDVEYIGVGIYSYGNNEHIHYVQLLVSF